MVVKLAGTRVDEVITALELRAKRVPLLSPPLTGATPCIELTGLIRIEEGPA